MGNRAIEIGSDSFGASRDVIIENNLFVKCSIGVNVKEASSASINNATFYETSLNLELLNESSAELKSTMQINNSVMFGEMPKVEFVQNSSFSFDNLMSNTMLEELNGIYIAEIRFADSENNDFKIISTDFPEGENASTMGYQKE